MVMMCVSVCMCSERNEAKYLYECDVCVSSVYEKCCMFELLRNSLCLVKGRVNRKKGWSDMPVVSVLCCVDISWCQWRVCWEWRVVDW